MTTQQAPPDDEALLLRARSGDSVAIEALYSAYYDAGRRFATSLAGADKAEDLVADVWAKVLSLLQTGRGPNDNFRAYLFTSIRNRFFDKMRVAGREQPVSDQPWLLDDITTPSDEILDEYDDDRAVAALHTLPDRWRKMLWQLEVEGRSVPEVADIHDIDAAAVSSAAYRAREGLRTAYLDQQINGHMHSDNRDCAWVRKRMSKYVRSIASARAKERIVAHTEVCQECEDILLGLQSTNRKFGLLLLPIVLAGASAGDKAALLWGGAGITGTLSMLWGRLWDLVKTPSGAVVTAAALFALAGPGAIWATQGGDPYSPPAGDAPASDAGDAPAGGDTAPPPASKPPASKPPATEPPATEPPASQSAPPPTDGSPAAAVAPVVEPDEAPAAPPAGKPPVEKPAPPEPVRTPRTAGPDRVGEAHMSDRAKERRQQGKGQTKAKARGGGKGQAKAMTAGGGKGKKQR